MRISRTRPISFLCRIARAGAAVFGLVLTIFCALGLSSDDAAAAVGDQRAALVAMTVVEEAGGGSRIVMSFDREVEVDLILLPSPPRLAIDLPVTGFAFDEPVLGETAFVKRIRYGLLNPATSRILLGIDDPFSVENEGFETSPDGATQDLTLVLRPAQAADFVAALAEQSARMPESRVAPKVDRLGDPRAGPDGRFVVMLDPGDGGIDGGAIGRGTGVEEKTIVLDFARRVRDHLGTPDNLVVSMTRDADVFVRLSERVRLARQIEANLFLSVHGDTVPQSYVRGATTYTLSDQASDGIARALAEQENLSDSIAGLPDDVADSTVTDILVDLTRRETRAFSDVFSTTIIERLRTDGIEVSSNPRRSGGFRVLTAPDIPSVLLEIGYLSNREDEALMTDPEWRDRAARTVAEAVLDYARAHGWEESPKVATPADGPPQ